MIRAQSLKHRLLMSVMIGLLFCFGFTAFILEHAFFVKTQVGSAVRLQGLTYALLKVANEDDNGDLNISVKLSDPRLLEPHSGLYAVVAKNNHIIWESPSTLGMTLPFHVGLKSGDSWSGFIEDQDHHRLHSMSYGVSLFNSKKQENHYTFAVAESHHADWQALYSFRQGLWGWLLLIVIFIGIVHWMILRWGLQPLKKVSQHLTEVEKGDRELLNENYPEELQQLTRNINTLLKNERIRQERYRNALADLAHSFKTPLAILNGVKETSGIVAEQVHRLNEMVSYHLKRASTSSCQTTFSKPVLIKPIINKILRSLRKVYGNKSVEVDLEIAPNAAFYGEAGDLLEIFGNILDNAFKWCDSRIIVSVCNEKNLVICVEDDGFGIPEDKSQLIKQRGVRADKKIEGHGIGMAVVDDIMSVYSGKLEVLKSPNVSGALIKLTFNR